MRIKALAAAAIVAASGVSLPATASATTDLGVLGTQWTTFQDWFFTPVGPFTDLYTFTLQDAASATGGTIQLDFGNLDISLQSVSLSGGTLGSGTTLVDNTPGQFSFSGLGFGQYQLAVTGTVSAASSAFNAGGAGYVGYIRDPPGAVPEPNALALVATGLFFLGLMGYRRKQT